MAAGQLRHAVAARCATNSNLAVADYARERKLDASVGHQFGSAHDADDTITQLVGCAVPIQQAGMGAASPPELAAAVSEAVSVPVIASGGAGSLAHLYDAVTRGGADAVLAASIFHYGTWRVRDAKDYLATRGVPVRPIE